MVYGKNYIHWDSYDIGDIILYNIIYRDDNNIEDNYDYFSGVVLISFSFTKVRFSDVIFYNDDIRTREVINNLYLGIVREQRINDLLDG